MPNLTFEQVPNPGHKTCRWIISSARTAEQLGYIEFRTGWRKYIWGMFNGVIFDVSCTQEVVDFLNAHKDDRQ